MKNALDLFEKIDDSLVTKASEAPPISLNDSRNESTKSKKRKQKQDGESLMDTHVPKKRNTSVGSSSATKTLILSQREENAMNDLVLYVEECGGKQIFPKNKV